MADQPVRTVYSNRTFDDESPDLLVDILPGQEIVVPLWRSDHAEIVRPCRRILERLSQ